MKLTDSPREMMDFGSDNEAPVRPVIMSAIVAENCGTVLSYGEDATTAALRPAFEELFGTDLEVMPVSTGTAANAISLSQVMPPHGATLCHHYAHIRTHECGAPEFFTGGKLIAVGGDNGKLDPAELRAVLKSNEKTRYHSNRASALSLSQATECGTVYTPDEISALAKVAHEHGLVVHLDGARLANAVAHLRCSPASITWQAGVDILSFGSSKNGTLNAEAIISFGSHRWFDDVKYRLKQTGHLLSKTRYLSAQLLAYINSGLWLEWAREANALATLMAEGLEKHEDIRLAFPVQANVVLVEMPQALADHLHKSGARFYPWAESPGCFRLVMSNSTDEKQVQTFLRLARAG
jgi:threonine aldolase